MNEYIENGTCAVVINAIVTQKLHMTPNDDENVFRFQYKF